jgi:DNA-binding transcriptional regulator YiaG
MVTKNINRTDAAKFRKQLGALDMTQIAFARELNREQHQVSRWATGRQPIPRYVWMALQMLVNERKKR